MPGGSGLGVDRISIKLVVPKDIKQVTVVDLAERGAKRIRRGVAETVSAGVKALIVAAGIGELLAELFVWLNGAAEKAGSLSGARTAGERSRVELKGSPQELVKSSKYGGIQ
jgi:hypothetical protein